MMSTSPTKESGLNLLTIIFLIYQVGIPVMGLYFLYQHTQHDVRGFGSFLWYMAVSSIEALIWPIALLWV